MTGQPEQNLHPVPPDQELTTVDQTNQALQAFRLECFFTVIGLVRKPLHPRPPPNYRACVVISVLSIFPYPCRVYVVVSASLVARAMCSERIQANRRDSHFA
jgi:hypothetical protein